MNITPTIYLEIWLIGLTFILNGLSAIYGRKQPLPNTQRAFPWRSLSPEVSLS